MATLITEGVEVIVETAYQPAHSNPAEYSYVHAYRITIINHNTFTVQLLRRKWIITDGPYGKSIVEGEGVVGRQPVLYPGDSHEYVSGCNLQSTIGRMEGAYIFQNKTNGKEFTVKIPRFDLVAPQVLN
ncbi:MAG: Co2+/Mg2+ efflux protein ApaG [Chitinophagales bacterium]|nr:Co2+/Mg2+ efflux protein ApaG [Chitinophagales bacterium]MDW8419861.1 Co2+/Mg2+ efflux protein ApaG [Chitinophagales bacterium]